MPLRPPLVPEVSLCDDEFGQLGQGLVAVRIGFEGVWMLKTWRKRFWKYSQYEGKL